MMANEQLTPAVAGPLDQPIVPLVERLRKLNAAFREDEGRDLNAVSVRLAMDFAARHTDPDSVSADHSGVVYFTWAGGDLTMRFLVNGATNWAGKLGESRPYGAGEPDVSLWPCLRHNVVLSGARTGLDGA